ncbi:acid stress chaperone HdeB [Ancylobacter sp. 3268]|uniref:HdeA/HdeB family chaperone n=1 Tax=Ancylobacter sp. 3268 TaxID=2817752 RepID=UPI00286564BB|nr:HdeA/HdeB family chaperone [Ancylobacter sp. 3268]MDR6952860.1 acid stress chaperone HdeB [Ancylobacter sp. 3268]
MKYAVVAVAFVLGVSPVMADKWDLSTMTCKQFTDSDNSTIGIILAWLDAYYKDEEAPPVIDTEKFVQNAEKLGAYCAVNPQIGLITATDSLFDSE